MNRMLIDGPQGKMVLCVLEPGNLRKLQERKPIEFSLNELGLYPQGLPAKLSIALMYSETPTSDAKQFKDMLAPGGKYVDTRSAKVATSRPHCPECSSTIEQLGVFRTEAPVWLVFCTVCGCTLGSMPPDAKMAELPREGVKP